MVIVMYKIFNYIFSLFLQGLATGGSYGLYEGLKNPDGKTFKLRLNGYLNWLNLIIFFRFFLEGGNLIKERQQKCITVNINVICFV